MSECPEPQKQQLACMQILGGLKQGQDDLREWMNGMSEKQDELATNVAFMRGKLCAERKSHKKLIGALTVLATAIAGAIASIWKLSG